MVGRTYVDCHTYMTVTRGDYSVDVKIVGDVHVDMDYDRTLLTTVDILSTTVEDIVYEGDGNSVELPPVRLNGPIVLTDEEETKACELLCESWADYDD